MPSALKAFARQFRRLELAGYSYIECPNPCISFLDMTLWMPPEDKIAELQQAILEEKGNLMKNLSYFYHKAHKCYYVLSSLWVALLPTWGPVDMKLYAEAVFGNMVKNSHVEPPKTMPVEPKIVIEKQPELEIIEVKEEPVKEMPALTKRILETIEKEDALEEEIERKISFLERYGVSQDVMTSIMKEGTELLGSPQQSGDLHVLDLCKALWKHWGVKMNDIHQSLKDVDFYVQKGHTKNIINLSKWVKDDHLGYDYIDDVKKTIYPVFTPKGVLHVSFILMERGLIPEHIFIR